MEKNIKGVFISPIKISLYHIVFSWMMFEVFQLKPAYIISFVAGIMSLLPLYSVGIIQIFVAFYIYFNEGVILALLYFTIYMFGSNYSFENIY